MPARRRAGHGGAFVRAGTPRDLQVHADGGMGRGATRPRAHRLPARAPRVPVHLRQPGRELPRGGRHVDRSERRRRPARFPTPGRTSASGDPSIRNDLAGAALKFEPDETLCSTDVVGSGTFVFYSPFAPGPIERQENAIAIKHGSSTCYGALVGPASRLRLHGAGGVAELGTAQVLLSLIGCKAGTTAIARIVNTVDGHPQPPGAPLARRAGPPPTPSSRRRFGMRRLIRLFLTARGARDRAPGPGRRRLRVGRDDRVVAGVDRPGIRGPVQVHRERVVERGAVRSLPHRLLPHAQGTRVHLRSAGRAVRIARRDVRMVRAEAGACTVLYEGKYNCKGDPTVPAELRVPTIKFDASTTRCKAGSPATGRGSSTRRSRRRRIPSIRRAWRSSTACRSAWGRSSAPCRWATVRRRQRRGAGVG